MCIFNIDILLNCSPLCRAEMLTTVGLLGSPKQKSGENPRKITRQILLSLCFSTRETAQRTGRSWKWLRGWLCLATFYKVRQSRLAERAGFFKTMGFLKRAGLHYWLGCRKTMFVPALWGKVTNGSLSLLQEGPRADKP